MKTLGEVFSLSSSYLSSKGHSRSKFIVQQLISHHLKLSKLELYMNFDKPLEEDELVSLRESLKRVSNGCPLEYEIGFVDFYGCKIFVNSSVLIPRQETELLIEVIVKKIGQRKLVVWDLCTGSGCIGISLKKKLPACEVVLSDISEGAIEVAKTNADYNCAEVRTLHGDLFVPFHHEKADVVVCNPPYISKSKYQLLEKSVKDFEPELALVAGETGVEFYERLALELPNYLRSKAQVFMEIGYDQEGVVNSIFSQSCWTTKQIIYDLAGHPRFFFLEIE
jgi:release factor glutamine methyltransferase